VDDQTARPGHPAGPQTLAIDIGGTRLKAGILATTGRMVAGPARTDTPHPSPPDAVIETLAGLVGPLGRFDRISIGFPLGVISGRGVECVITLGTGMGFALFENGVAGPHLELSQHPVSGRRTYDQYIGNAAFRAVGRKRWNRRVRKAIDYINTLTSCDTLYIGGGNAKNLQLELPSNVRIVSNEAGITGGIRLWDAFAAA
jgi:polyphosphate glucokinase